MLTQEEMHTYVNNYNEGNAGNQILCQSLSMLDMFTKGFITCTVQSVSCVVFTGCVKVKQKEHC